MYKHVILLRKKHLIIKKIQIKKNGKISAYE